MARIDLQCVCGFFFAVADHQLAKAACPSCGKPAARPAPAAAASASALDHKKLKLIIGGGVAAVVLCIAVVVLVLMSRSGENPYEKELERADRKSPQKKTAVEAATPSAPGGAAPKIPPTKVPVTAAVKTPASTPAKAAPSSPPPSKAAAPKPGPVTLKNPLSAELAKRLKDEIFTLNPFYLGSVLEGYSPERFTQLSNGAQATDEEAAQVMNLLSGARSKAARDDQSRILELYASAEKEAFEGLPVDRVKMKDARVIQCRIVEDGAEVVKVERRLAGGVGGFLNLRREEIELIEKGKGIGADWPARWELALKSPPAQQQATWDWCKTNALTGQAKLMALLLLKGDPSIQKARIEAGLAPDPVKFSEDMARGGIISFQGRNWGAKELKLKLLKDGYALMDGKWFGKKERTISVPGLFKYEGQSDQPVQISSVTAPLSHDEETVFKLALDAGSGSFSEQPEVRLLRRFYAPTLGVMPSAPLKGGGYNVPVDTVETRYQLRVDNGSPGAGTPTQGEVLISVPLDVPLLEASVMTLAEVKGGGSITVYLVNGDGPRTKLYTCSGKEDGLHKLPDSIKGRTQVDLAVVISAPAAYSTKAERRTARPVKKNNNRVIEQGIVVVHYRLIPEYKAVLFPSTSNTFEVFRLKAQVAESLPLYDKLFEQCPELLKEEAPK